MASSLSYVNVEQQILHVIAANMAEEAKELLIKYCCRQSLGIQEKEACCNVLNLAIKWITCESDASNVKLLVDSGRNLLKIWCENKSIAVVTYFRESVLLKLLESRHNRIIDVLKCVLPCLKEYSEIYFKLCEIVSREVTTIIAQDDIIFCGSWSLFLAQYSECLPCENSELSRLNVFLIQCLGKTQIPNTTKDEQIKFFGMVQNVCELLNLIWQKGASQNFIEISLREVFEILSNPSYKNGVALSNLTNYVPDDVINSMINVIISTNIANDTLFSGLSKIMQWLVWPRKTQVSSWILTFFKCLRMAGKKDLLCRLIRAHILKVFCRVYLPVIRENNFIVLGNMLINCLDSSDVFHLIVPHIPNLVDRLRKENNDNSQYYIKALGELVYTLMYRFPDELGITYKPLLAAFEDIPKPTVQMMKKWINSVDGGCTSTQPVKPFVFTKEMLRALIKQKTGLLNLGNTCYVNSILQCFFMLEKFRNAVFSKSVSILRHPVMYSLQDVFTFLLLSKRNAIAPENFLRHSRPPWFPLRTQQDCCEFVHYLMDKLEEEDRCLFQDDSEASQPSTNIVEEYFKGVLSVTYKCLNCGNESIHKEDFTDILLAFPEIQDLSSGDISTDEENSLKGGDKTPSFHEESLCNTDIKQTSYPTSGIQTSTKTTTMNEIKTGRYGIEKRSVFTIQEMLDYFTKPEKLIGNNQYYCDLCNANVNGERHVSINKLPCFLMFSLKRFSFDVVSQTKPKLLHVVNYPEELYFHSSDYGMDLLSEMDTSITEDVSMINDEKDDMAQQYKLCSVVFHSGHTCEAGHYYSYALDKMNKQWYSFNDESTNKSSYEHFMEKEKSSLTDTTYILIYMKYGKGQSSNASDPPSDIVQKVEQDNQKFFQEISHQSFDQISIKSGNNKDNDSPPPPPGSCGSNGTDFTVSGNRFIF